MKFSSLFSIALVGLAMTASSLLAQEAAAPPKADPPKTKVDQETRQRKGKTASGKATTEKPPTIYWPKDVKASSEIPTPKEFFGFEVGHRHLRHDQVAAYMQELARRSDRITIQQYAETHGGRPCLLLTITSPSNHGRLSEIQRRHRQR